MTDTTARLLLPFIAPNQAQKHVTHNEGLQILDAVTQLSLQSLSLTTPPEDSVEGQCWYVAEPATGAWEAQNGKIAIWQAGAWAFIDVEIGWRAWVQDDAVFKVWNGSAWQEIAGQSSTLQNLPELGVNATADATNRLSMRSPASLFSHEGSDHRLNINKNESADTGSILYQTGFSSRVEMGLTGSDDFQMKVSPNGSTWREALEIDRETAAVTFPGSENDKLLQTWRFSSHPNVNNGNWYRLCQWQTTGNFNVTTAILHVSHRTSLTFHTLKLRFEIRTAGFGACDLRVEGDPFREGENYLLVATNADSRVTLYHKRASGHFSARYMSVGHMWRLKSGTQFDFSEASVGPDEPEGDLMSKVTQAS